MQYSDIQIENNKQANDNIYNDNKDDFEIHNETNQVMHRYDSINIIQS